MKGLAIEAGARVRDACAAAPFTSVHELAERARLNAEGSACLLRPARSRPSLSIATARSEVAEVAQPTELLPQVRFAVALPILRRPTEAENIAADHRHVGVSLG